MTWEAVTFSVLLLVFGLIQNAYRDILKNPNGDDYARLSERLTQDGGIVGDYRARVGRLLHWADEFFEGKKLPTYVKVNPWSHHAFDRCLMLAVIYPYLSAVIGWVIFGNAGVLGDALFLQAQPNTAYRVTYGLTCVVGIGLVNTSASFRFSAGLAILVGGYILTAKVFGVTGCLGLFIVSLIFGNLLSNNENQEDREDYNGLLLLNLALFVALTYSNIKFSYGIKRVILAAVPTFVGLVIILKSTKWAFPNRRPYIAIGFYMFCLTIFATYGVVAFGILPQSWPFLLPVATIIVLIPVINLPFDYFSIGLTRYALKKSFNAKSQWKRTKWALIDLCTAFIMMIALCIIMIFMLEALNAAALHGGADFVPAPVADQIREISSSQGFQGQHFWLYFALFSTLLPTAIHMTIWAVSLSTIVLGRSDRLSRMINPAIMAQSDTKRHIAAAILAFQWIVAIALVAAVILALYHGARNASFIAGPFLWLMENTQQASANLFK